MDKEMLSNSRSGRASCSKLGLLVTAALVLCTLFSSVAMVMSILTYYNYQRDMRADVMVIRGDGLWMKEATAELEKMFEEEGVMSFRNKTDSLSEATREQRDVNDREAEYDALCNSTNPSGKNSDSIPIAHIVPKPLLIEQPISEGRGIAAVVVTKQWTCGRPQTSTKGHEFGIIAGGMVFDRSSGFLIVPTDGVYYIYSHIQFRLKSTNKTFETMAQMVACIPGDSCEMIDVHSLPSLVESSDTVSPFQNRISPSEVGENGIYQGGLFHFPANTRITLLARNPKWNVRRTRTNYLHMALATGDSYMGAYLVQRMHYNRPSM